MKLIILMTFDIATLLDCFYCIPPPDDGQTLPVAPRSRPWALSTSSESKPRGKWKFEDGTCVFVKEVFPLLGSSIMGTKEQACKKTNFMDGFDIEPYKTHIFQNIKETLENVCCGLDNMTFTMHNISKIYAKGKFDFMFPVLAYSSSELVHGHRFIPMLDPPGAFYIAPKQQILLGTIAKDCFQLWPVLVLAIFLSMVAGFVAWAFETRSNEEEFPRPFFRGWFEGTWWSVISMTTVGYGDKTPKTIVGRLFSIVWIMAGIVVFCVLAGELTTVIFEAKRGNEHSMVKKRVGTLDRLYEKSLVARYGGILSSLNKTRYSGEVEQLLTLIKRLNKGKIDGVLIDKYSYNYMQEELVGTGVSNGASTAPPIRANSLISFFTNMVVTDISHSGKDVSYGALVRKDNFQLFSKFQPIFENNKLAFQATMSLQFRQSSFEDEDDGDDEFYEKVFHGTFLVFIVIMVVIVAGGTLYEGWRWRRGKETHTLGRETR